MTEILHTGLEYYMKRFDSYYFRDKLGSVKVELHNIDLHYDDKQRLDSLTYGEKYNIQVNPLKLIVNE